jgi:hypothetical protein
MLYANNQDAEKVLARPGEAGSCPQCHAGLIPKCGTIKRWHWAHVADAECDPWAEHESQWHLDWKDLCRPEFVEVPMGPHRADIRRPDGLVIELQNSAISPQEIAERQRFYGNMVWVFNADQFSDNLGLRLRDGYWSFRWKWPRFSQVGCRRLFWDLGRSWEYGYLFEVKKVHRKTPCGGWGRMWTRPMWESEFLAPILKRPTGFEKVRGPSASQPTCATDGSDSTKGERP